MGGCAAYKLSVAPRRCWLREWIQCVLCTLLACKSIEPVQEQCQHNIVCVSESVCLSVCLSVPSFKLRRVQFQVEFRVTRISISPRFFVTKFTGWFAIGYYIVRQKVSPKVVCHFLSNHLEFLREILHVYYTCSYTRKNAKRHLIAFNYYKVTEFLCVTTYWFFHI